MSAESSPATPIFTEGNLIQSKMKKEGRNRVLHQVSTTWTSTGLGGNHITRYGNIYNVTFWRVRVTIAAVETQHYIRRCRAKRNFQT